MEELCQSIESDKYHNLKKFKKSGTLKGTKLKIEGYFNEISGIYEMIIYHPFIQSSLSTTKTKP
jgi:hypothetical protein